MTFHEYKTDYQLLYNLTVSSGKCYSPDEYYSKKIEAVKKIKQNVMPLLAEQEFYKLKKPTYKLYSDLAFALIHTEIDIPTEELQLPFKVFEIRLKPKTIQLAKSQYLSKYNGNIYLGAILVSVIYNQNINETRLYMLIDIYDELSTNIENSQLCTTLLPGKTIKESFEDFQNKFDKSKNEEFLINQDKEKIIALTVGTIFLAISKNKKWISGTKIKIKNKDFCLCNSGKKYRDCCARTKNSKGNPIGYDIGKDILIPYQPSKSSTVVESRGDRLQYGHIRSGHMRWQWKNDSNGNKIRELIFIYPTIVRPDLPLKPQLTYRTTKNDEDGQNIK